MIHQDEDLISVCEVLGVKVGKRCSDGYINASVMCVIGNKKFADYTRLKSTKDYLRELSEDAGIPVFSTSVSVGLIDYAPIQIGSQETWIHPEVAIDLKRWIVKSSIGKKRNKQERVYFIHNKTDKSIKIGYSSNIASRFKTLQTANSCDLYLIGSIEGGKSLEQSLHVLFRKQKLGGEWFRDTILEQAKAIVSGGGIDV